MKKNISRWLALVAGGLLAANACAYECPHMEGAIFDILLPTSLTVGRDVPTGGLISPWATLDGVVGGTGLEYFRCWIGELTDVGVYDEIYASFESNNLVDSGLKYDGFTIWKTNLAGVGVVIKTSIFVDTDAPGQKPPLSGWTSMTNVYPIAAQTGNYWKVTSPGAYRKVNIATKSLVALAKIGPIAGGKITPAYVFRFYVDGSTGRAEQDRRYEFRTTTINVGGTCTTPDVAVDLGKSAASTFANKGSRSGTVKFNLEIKNCPTGMQSVAYRINAPSGSDATLGLIGLTSASTAKGLKVKLMNAADSSAVKLDVNHSVNYATDVGGNYSVALAAAFERTSDTAVQGGKATAQATFSMIYN
jgi:major type 1 subunit fimbrin (pilin)